MIDGFGSFIGEPKEDDARLVEYAERENVAEVEIPASPRTAVAQARIGCSSS
jgi:hypothetical protein